MPALIHHLAPAADIQALGPGQPYLPAGFAADGFVHCTGTLAVLLEVANRFYQAQPGAFVVLDLDPVRLTSPVRYEAPGPPAAPDSPLAGVLFPHVYGPINPEAIVSVRPAARSADGHFLSV
jgi:uncharacterized protein (DUF952 family)